MNEWLVDYSLINLAISNPDFFTTLVTLFIFLFMMLIIIVPIIRWQNKRFDRLLDSFQSHTEEDWKYLWKIFNAIDIHNKMSEWQFTVLQATIWSKTIDKESAILMLKKSMLSWIYKKLDFLEKRLNKNNLKERKEIIKRQIRVELLKLSDEEYLDFLDWFTLNWVKLWDLIRNTFKFDEFLEEIFDCIFDNKIDETWIKLKNILEVMKFYQNECIEDVRKII